MQGNNLGSRIDEKAFSGVSQYIEDLNLSWSNLTALHGNTLRGMIELENLTLAENRLQHVQPNLLQDLRNLARLSLAGNPIKYVQMYEKQK